MMCTVEYTTKVKKLVENYLQASFSINSLFQGQHKLAHTKFTYGQRPQLQSTYLENKQEHVNCYLILIFDFTRASKFMPEVQKPVFR